MIEMDKIALLLDLAHLVKKYGPTVFSDLAGVLRDPEAVAELVSILEVAEVSGRKACVTDSRRATNRVKGGKLSVPKIISEIEKNDPAKAQVLSDFHGTLAAKRALPTLRELRSFVLDNGFKEVETRSRNRAIGQLLRDMAAHPLEDIRSMLGRIRMEDTAGDRSLEGWTNVILDKGRPRSE